MNNIPDVILLEDKSSQSYLNNDDLEAQGDGFVDKIHEERQSKKLVVHDILMIGKNERERMIPLLREEYGIDFVSEIKPVEHIITFTSQKCIIEDQTGKRYFLKQKPEYSLKNGNHLKAAKVQSLLAKKTSIVPAVIPNRQGDFHGIIGTKTFLLTPFIEGGYFSGKIEESIEAAKALGILHKILSEELKGDDSNISAYDEALFFIDLANNANYQDKNLHQKVIDGLKELSIRYKDGSPVKANWLHGDFTPFNLIYQNGKVVGVNDFDNVGYGAITRDIGECLLKHSGVCYAGTTSSFRAPIPKVLDEDRMKLMLRSYLSENPLTSDDLADLGNQTILIWIESLSLGLVRGDYSLQDVERVLDFGPELVKKFNSIL